jgi:aryl-alcohol dehydrogenase-like predicted oxidoreductase
VDIFHVHGVTTDEYAYAVEVIVPVLQQLKSEGKVRFIGITEAFASDPGHKMLEVAEKDGCWDVMMVGFNLLNQSARERVFPWMKAKGIGTLDMFAVRRALTDPVLARAVIQDLVKQGSVMAENIDQEDPLGFLVAGGVATSLSEAAYRYCRHEPGIDVVLSGTGSIEHLRENAESLSQPALPDAVLTRLGKMFARVDTVSGN